VLRYSIPLCAAELADTRSMVTSETFHAETTDSDKGR